MSDLHARTKGKLNLRGRRLLVVGLAREGTALARYLSKCGAHVVATDLKPPQFFGNELTPLIEAGVELILGEHPLSLLDECEVAFVSPGVPFDAALLDEARARGIPLSTESRLFCQLCPAPIAAITGSSGKTTTTTLVGEILTRSARGETDVRPSGRTSRGVRGIAMFAKTVRTGEEPRATTGLALDALATVEAGLHSVAENRRVTLAETLGK